MHPEPLAAPDVQPDRLAELFTRLERIEEALALLARQRQVKEWYSTAEAALLLDRAEFTVREWCRLGRVHAEKRRCGRGRCREWMISHGEVTRVRNQGLLPCSGF